MLTCPKLGFTTGCNTCQAVSRAVCPQSKQLKSKELGYSLEVLAEGKEACVGKQTQVEVEDDHHHTQEEEVCDHQIYDHHHKGPCKGCVTMAHCVHGHHQSHRVKYEAICMQHQLSREAEGPQVDGLHQDMQKAQTEVLQAAAKDYRRHLGRGRSSVCQTIRWPPRREQVSEQIV